MADSIHQAEALILTLQWRELEKNERMKRDRAPRSAKVTVRRFVDAQTFCDTRFEKLKFRSDGTIAFCLNGTTNEICGHAVAYRVSSKSEDYFRLYYIDVCSWCLPRAVDRLLLTIQNQENRDKIGLHSCLTTRRVCDLRLGVNDNKIRGFGQPFEVRQYCKYCEEQNPLVRRNERLVKRNQVRRLNDEYYAQRKAASASSEI